MPHKTRTDLIGIWSARGGFFHKFEECLEIITDMPTSELRTILDEFHKQDLHRDMHEYVYTLIVGEMMRRIDPREFRAYGTY